MEPIPRGVMWEEGLFLQPHHLQQQALAAYALAARFAGRAHPHLWGVVELEVDPLALERGQLVVLRLEAILPSGEVFSYAHDKPGNALLEPREIPKPDGDRITAYVGVRRLREQEPNVREPQDGGLDPPRWVRDTALVADLVTGRNQQDVHFLRMNGRILFDGDRMDGFEVLPIAHLEAPSPALPPRRPSAVWAPPAIRIGAAATILATTKEIFQEAAAKEAELSGAATVADLLAGHASEAEAVQIAKLLVLRGALPLLREAAETGVTHPYDLFHHLASFLGQFAALSAGTPAPKLPLYDHMNVGGCFDALARPLLGVLRADQLAANYRRLTLSPGNLGIGGVALGASGVDAELLHPRHQIYLVFSNPEPSGPERNWYQVGLVKVAAVTRIKVVVAQRKYGVSLLPCPKPRALPARNGALYYRLQTDASAHPEAQAEWAAVQRERTLVVHFATDGIAPGRAAPDLGMEAYVVFGR
jgi:type VI secretion system protein ImpJ